jgi:hypothetical protein
MTRIVITLAPGSHIVQRASQADDQRIHRAAISTPAGEALDPADVVLPWSLSTRVNALRIEGRLEVDADLGDDGAWIVTKAHVSNDVLEVARMLSDVGMTLDLAQRSGRDDDAAAKRLHATLRAARAVAAQRALEAADPEYAEACRTMMRETSSPMRIEPDLMATLSSEIVKLADRAEDAGRVAGETDRYAFATIWSGTRSDLSVIPGDRLVAIAKRFIDAMEHPDTRGAEQYMERANAMLGSLLDAVAKVPARRSLLEETALHVTSDLGRGFEGSAKAYIDRLQPDVRSRMEALIKKWSADMLIG